MNLKTAVRGEKFITGTGELADLIRSFDWSNTSIGSIDQWSASLRTSVNLILNSRFPMLLMWGTELTQFYNDAFRPSLGINGKHPSALGQTAIGCWEEIWDIIWPLLNKVITTGEPVWSEDQLVPIYRNGKIEDVYWTFCYSPAFNQEGKIEGVLVVCNETTEKVVSTRNLKENQEQLKLALTAAENSDLNFRNLMMQAPVAMCILEGPQFLVEVANNQMCEIWGKERTQVLHLPIFEGLPEARKQGLEELLQFVYRTGERFTGNERPVSLPRNGKLEIVYLNFVYEALKDREGNISSIMAIATDVTNQVIARMNIEESGKRLKTFSEQMEQKVAERTLELQKMNTELQNFAYVASHDLQEPLRKIQTYSDRLLDKESTNLSDSGKEYFRRMQSAAGRMQALINDLLDYSRTNNPDLKVEHTDLNELLNDVINELKDVILEKQAVIEANELCEANVIPFQFRQVIQNLISNSLKFSKPGTPPHINIHSEIKKGKDLKPEQLNPDAEYCHLSFADNGIGFDLQYKHRIFDMFQRLNGRSEYEGTGIGLAIVNKIIENHKGLITANSELGKGATFDMYIPN